MGRLRLDRLGRRPGAHEARRRPEDALRRYGEHQLSVLTNQLWRGLKSRHPQLLMNGAHQPRLAHNLNITVPAVSGNRLHRCLKRSLACSSGSACSRGKPSHVLQAIGRSRVEAEASLRLSLGRTTTATDINRAVEVIAACISQLDGSQ